MDYIGEMLTNCDLTQICGKNLNTHTQKNSKNDCKNKRAAFILLLNANIYLQKLTAVPADKASSYF